MLLSFHKFPSPWSRTPAVSPAFPWLPPKFANPQIVAETIKNKKKMEVTITTENFESYKNGSLPLVVDLWATWCGPCRMLAPIVSELASEYDGKIVVGKCDVEENEDIAMEFGVRNIPTLLFFKDGKLVDKFVGSAKKPALVEKFQALL